MWPSPEKPVINGSLSTPEQAAIRKLLEDRFEALRANDAGTALADHAADLASFDLAPPLRQPTRDALDPAVLQEWLDSWRGPVDHQLHDFDVSVGGDVAFGHGLVRICGTKRDGEDIDLWVRSTVCLRKEGNDWQIAHEHTPVPFHMDGSYRAATDLQPEAVA